MSLIKLDDNGRAIYGPMFSFVEKKNMVFAGGTTNDPGDKDGTSATTKLFDVTGDVMCMVIGVCKDTLVGAATLEVGVANATAALIAQLSNATTLAVNEVWADATPTLAESIATRFHVIGGGLDINQLVASADITAGEIDYYCFWQPLSDDGLVVAA